MVTAGCDPCFCHDSSQSHPAGLSVHRECSVGDAHDIGHLLDGGDRARRKLASLPEWPSHHARRPTKAPATTSDAVPPSATAVRI